MLANKSFSTAVAKLSPELQGANLSRFDWQDQDGQPLGESRPWCPSLDSARACVGHIVTLKRNETDPRCYVIHSSPIIADDGSRHGALVIFEDVTELETKRVELTRALEVLRSSRDQVREQNEQLHRLATTDPLTGCMNRRSFYEAFESQWNSAQQNHRVLSFVMVDLDHFKSTNDTHGHGMGDVVRQQAAETVRNCVRSNDLVCRYGGEEFCVLLPHTEIAEAAQLAEGYRKAVEAIQLPEICVTASLGVSSLPLAANAQDMIEQADKCLYVAKRQGRNQVVAPMNLVHQRGKIFR